MSHKRERAEYNKLWHERNKDRVAEYRKKYAAKHREKLLVAKRKWYEDHREEIKAKNKVYRINNWDKVNAYDRQRLKDNPDRAKHHQELRKNARLEVIKEYGGKCACCGEPHSEFLVIDHVYEDGAIHRKAGKAHQGYGVYVWLKRSGFPKAYYQLLCFNCNIAKSRYGTCPHRKPFGMEASG